MVIITDCFYRSAICAIYSFNKLGEKIIGVTTDNHPKPPAFYSKYLENTFVLPSNKELYKKTLEELCLKYDKPIIFPIGVFTLDIISKNLEDFEKVARFCVSDENTIETVNDKGKIKDIAISVGIKVPKRFTKDNARFPAVIKPACGEKNGLKASERYEIVKNSEELQKAEKKYSGTSPIIEEYVNGKGVGVSLVIGKNGTPYSAFCHRRLSEYPASGGPSSSLITIKNEELINQSVKLLQKANFSGIAMVEYKENDGKYYLLEVNPRIWGSFGATLKADSDFVKAYMSASLNENYEFSPRYVVGKKIKFLPNIFASVISYTKAKQLVRALSAFIDGINPFVPNPCFSIKDPMPGLLDIIRKRR